MNGIAELPAWAAVVVAVLVVFGSAFTLIGSIGLLRFKTFYERVHAPTLGSSFGAAAITLAHILCFSVWRNAIALGGGLVFILVTLTVPVGLMLLVRAALFRDRAEGNPDVPPVDRTQD